MVDTWSDVEVIVKALVVGGFLRSLVFASFSGVIEKSAGCYVKVWIKCKI
jgi:hypothetical protein